MDGAWVGATVAKNDAEAKVPGVEAKTSSIDEKIAPVGNPWAGISGLKGPK